MDLTIFNKNKIKVYLFDVAKYGINILEGEIMVNLKKSVQYIKGVGPARAQLLEKLRYTYFRRVNYIFSKRI